MHSSRDIGSKARTLQILKKKYAVPDFFCIARSEIAHILAQEGISKKDIQRAFDASPDQREKLRQRILSIKTVPSFEELLNLGKHIIVRSAVMGEDSSQHSFAGIYESVSTKNTKESFPSALLQVISSAYSERAYHYLKNIGRTSFADMTVIVQRYIEATYAGVTFSTTTFKGKNGTLINFVHGGCEHVVLGKDVTELFVTTDVPKTSLPSHVLQEVIRTSQEIEKKLGSPQDIEWAYADTLHILQSRPITQEVSQKMRVWDNSNISESYSGIILPLTCSFIQYVYAQVYKDVARTSAISQRKIQENDEIFENLLGFFYGRVYYNMLHWYTMLTLFPGYDRNKKNLDMMITARSRAELDELHKRNVSVQDKIVYYMNLIKRVSTFRKDLERFEKHVDEYLIVESKRNYESLSLSELWNEFDRYENELLSKWSITVDNDYLAMTWFGIYKTLALKRGLGEQHIMQQLHFARTVISARQVDALIDLSRTIYKDAKSKKLLEQKKYEECYLHIQSTQDLRTSLQEYLNIYGGRFANELKLETPDLDTDPLHIMQLLTLYSSQQKRSKEASVRSKDGMLITFTKNKAMKYLYNRENLRLLRTRAYSHGRKLFLHIGRQLASKNLLENEQDVFYVTMQELRNASTNNSQLQSIVQQRKQEYSTYESVTLDNVMITYGDALPEPIQDTPVEGTQLLKGTGCSSGQVEGTVLVLEEYSLPDQEIDIIVAKNTDPGWTPLLGLCKGLIVENGGLLSHAAIVARELGIPCVIGASHATRILKNGNTVRMDGNTGTIHII